MTDRYQSFTASPIGKLFVKNLGLPNPTPLERWTEGAPLVDGTVVTGGSGRLGKALDRRPRTASASPTWAPPPEGEKYKGLVFDATGLTALGRPARAAAVLHPADAQPRPRCARVVVLGTVPEQTASGGERVAQRALEGFTRSLGKEIGKGSTVNLVYVAPGAEDDARVHAGLLPLPQERLRLRPGRPPRRDRHHRGRARRRPGQAADRQGRHRHRRLARHRRADRPGAAPRRRDRARHRRARRPPASSRR